MTVTTKIILVHGSPERVSEILDHTLKVTDLIYISTTAWQGGYSDDFVTQSRKFKILSSWMTDMNAYEKCSYYIRMPTLLRLKSK